MIDKRIFYCWFGNGEMTQLNKNCMESWKKMCPDYEIVRIDESNFDYHITPYAETAYEHGNWSYVSNAARLEFLKHNNGFYLDTDVMLFKSLDSLRHLDGGFITEFDTSQPDSGVLGRGENFPKFYEEVYDRLLPGTVLHKEFIQVMYRDYDVCGRPVLYNRDGFTVLGEEFFPSVRTNLFTEHTIGIHYFENTWVKQWTSVTDGFYPFPRILAKFNNKIVHADNNPEVFVKLKNTNKKWNHPEVLGRLLYFFNPNVVKMVTRDFEARRISHNPLYPTDSLMTPNGTLVTYLKKEIV